MGRKKKIQLMKSTNLDGDMHNDLIFDKSFLQLSPTREIGMRLKVLRQMTGLTLEDFYLCVKITPSMGGRYERAETRIRTDTCRAIITQLFAEFDVYCSLKWLLRGEGSGPVTLKNKSIELANLLGSKDDSYETKLLCIAQLYKETSDKNVLCVVRDRFMGSLFAKGAIVVGRLLDLNNPSELSQIVNSNCIIETRKHKQLVRLLTYRPKKNVFTVQCWNHYGQADVISVDELNYVAKVTMIVNCEANVLDQGEGQNEDILDHCDSSFDSLE